MCSKKKVFRKNKNCVNIKYITQEQVEVAFYKFLLIKYKTFKKGEDSIMTKLSLLDLYINDYENTVNTTLLTSDYTDNTDNENERRKGLK